MDIYLAFDPMGEAAGENDSLDLHRSSSCLAPQPLKPYPASIYLLLSPGASDIDVPTSELGGSSSGLSLGNVVPQSVPLDSSRVESAGAIFAAMLERSEGKQTKQKPKAKRVKMLVDIVEGLPKELLDGSLEFCSSQLQSIFKPEKKMDPEAESIPETFEVGFHNRLDRLKRIRKEKIRKGAWEASRLWFICIAHEVEYISQWDGIKGHTRRGVDRVSAAIEMVNDKVMEDDLRRSRHILQVLREGGPAAMLLDNGNRPSTIWERDMNMKDIMLFYTYKRDLLPHLEQQTRSHDHEASHIIKDCFLAYGWSSKDLLRSDTKVMRVLRPYLQLKRLHASDRPDLFESTNKKSRVCLPDNIVESMLQSNSLHPIYDARNGPRDLTRNSVLASNSKYSGRMLPPISTLIGPDVKNQYGIEKQAVHDTAALDIGSGTCGDHVVITPFPTAVSSKKFKELDHQCTELATLLGFLGRADIPIKMLLRAAKEKRFFDQEGEVQFAPPLNLIPLLAHAQDLESALELLDSLQLIKFSISLEDKPIQVKEELRSLIATTLPRQRDMEYKASLLVFHSFPAVDADPDCRDLLSILGKSQLPHIQHVVKYFDEPDFVNQFSIQQREQIVLSCISSSLFDQLNWKRRALDTAAKIIHTHKDLSPLLGKLRLRELVLARLYGRKVPDWTQESSHAIQSEMSLLRAQFMIYEDNMSQGWYELENWKLDDSVRAGQRCFLLQKKILLQIRICRFAGDLTRAKELLHDIKRRGLCQSIVPYYFADLVSVHCESGEFDDAMEHIASVPYAEESWVNLGPAARRTSHVAANTRLMRGLWILKKTKSDGLDCALKSLHEAKAIYNSLNKIYGSGMGGLACAIRHFSVAAGLAMIAHVESRFGSTVTGLDALSNWQAACEVGEISGGFLGGTPFPEMIMSYSMCDVTFRLGLQEETAGNMKRAKSLYRRTGRQFQYPALGSIWFDLVRDWNTENGLSRITELDYDSYVAKQKSRGYPYENNSRRLYD